VLDLSKLELQKTDVEHLTKHFDSSWKKSVNNFKRLLTLDIKNKIDLSSEKLWIRNAGKYYRNCS
jgi:hypothetical protein